MSRQLNGRGPANGSKAGGYFPACHAAQQVPYLREAHAFRSSFTNCTNASEACRLNRIDAASLAQPQAVHQLCTARGTEGCQVTLRRLALVHRGDDVPHTEERWLNASSYRLRRSSAASQSGLQKCDLRRRRLRGLLVTAFLVPCTV